MPPLSVNGVPLGKFADDLQRGHCRYQVGPFTIQLHTPLRSVAELLHTLYGDCRLAVDSPIADFHVRLERVKSIRRWYRPQVRFVADAQSPFAPFPADTAFPLLEWGLNWCVSTRAHHYLLLHAAAVEKNGRALLLPAWPGSGKSTLCAALVHRGWRLLSDEFGIVSPNQNSFVPFPRCITLKNESIEVIRDFASDVVMGPTFPRTRKGAVAHVRPPARSTARAQELAQAAWIVFPRYDPSKRVSLQALPKSRAFMKLSGNSFNYELLGEAGFRTVASVIRSSDCYLLSYGDLEDAVKTLNDLPA